MEAFASPAFFPLLAWKFLDEVHWIVLWLFSLAIALMFTCRLWRLRVGKDNIALARSIPGTLTSLGILGTFLGIFIGLLGIDFSTKEATDDSVRRILEGLQFAFLTSILGLASAILFRWDLNGHIKKVPPPITMRHLHERLEEIANGVQNFSAEVAGKAAAAVVDALMEETRKTFEKLREATEQLTEWQKRHLERMLEMERSLDAVVAELEKAGVAIREAVEAAATAIGMLEEPLKRLGEAADRASILIESLEKTAARATTVIRSLEAAAELLQERTDALKEELKAIANLGESAASAIPKMADAAKQVEASMTQIQVSAAQATSFVQETGRALELMKETSQSVRSESEKAVATLRREMQSALNEMARHLGGITTRFAEDYQPLLAEMRKVVEAGARARDV